MSGEPEPRRSLRDLAFSAAELHGVAPPKRRELVPDLIARGAVTALNGDGGAGKTILALQLGLAVTTGTTWLGMNVAQGAAIFWSAEEDLPELHRRLDRLSIFAGVELQQAAALTLLDMTAEDAAMAVSAGDRILETERFAELRQMAIETRPALIVTDNLAEVYGGDEVNRSQARAFMAAQRSLAKESGAAVLLLGHPSQEGLRSGSGTSGSTAFRNSARSLLYLREKPKEPGEQSDPNLRVLETKKNNYSAIGNALTLRLEGGGFRRIDDADEHVDRASADLGVDLLFLGLLDIFKAEGRKVGDQPGRSYAPAQFALDPRARGVRSKGLEQAMRRLFASGKIRVQEEGPPSKRVSRLVRVE